MFREKLREFGGIPHLNVPTIALLEYVVDKESHVLEFGSGSSTLWFAERACRIISYESEKGWHGAVIAEAQKRGLKNLVVHLDFEYWKHLGKLEGQEYDIILIDGAEHINARESCIRETWRYLAEGGYFVVDDTHRKRYEKEIEFIDGFGWTRWDITGPDHWEKEKRATIWRKS
jgi:predicted O-methyltransferase YrrM